MSLSLRDFGLGGQASAGFDGYQDFVDTDDDVRIIRRIKRDMESVAVA